jgi:hypothetical protein
MGRLIGAVVAGFLWWTFLWLGGHWVLRRASPESFAEDGTTQSVVLLAVLLVWSVVCTLAAGYLTAHIAREWARRAVLALAGILLGVGIVVQVQFWDVMPLWYHLLFLVLLFPMTLVGARLRDRPARAVHIGT